MKNKKVSERLFEVAKPYWDKIVEHPFIEEMSKGILEEDIFRYYTLQDNSYLIEFAKVFALGITKSKNLEDIKEFLTFMDGALGSETETHNEFLKSIGITKEDMKNEKTNIVNKSYTNYMISVASSGGPAECAAAVLTCNWSYEYIARMTKHVGGYKNNNYCNDWYKIYTSDYFIRDVKANFEMVDRLAKDYTEEQIQYLEEIIETCSHYEYLFWHISYNKGQVDNLVRV